MDSTTLLLAAGLFLAWVLGPLIILEYRLVQVPKRYEEIKDRFLSDPKPEPMIGLAERGKSGAWHYARILHPNADPADPEATLCGQFWHFHGWNRYALPLSLVVLLSGLMLLFSFMWLTDRPGTPSVSPEKPAASQTNNPAASATNNLSSPAKPASLPQVNKTSGSLLSGIKLPLVMALWGAFVWSLYEILSRRKSGDLTPVELYEVAFRLVSAVPLGYASALLVPESVAAFMAFAVSALPLRDIRQIVRKQSLQKLSESPTSSSSLSSKGYLGEALSGMGNDTLARLQELNIETVLDLAYADPIRLVIKTGVPIQLALSWIDQALLAVYVLELKPKFEKLGMPCALDICEFYTRNCFDVATGQDKDWRNNQAVKDLAAKLDIPIENLVPQLLRSIFDDPHTQFLVRVWYGPATTPNEL